MAKVNKNLKIFRKGKNQSHSMVINYILVISLIALLLYSIYYVIRVTKSSKEEFTSLKNENCKYTVVYVYSSTCPFCISFEKTFEEFMSKVKSYVSCDLTIGKKEISELTSDEHKLYNVSAFPTIVVLDASNKVVDKLVGKRDLETLLREISGLLKLDNSVAANH